MRAVLFDRDGTLVHDVPYNGDPDLVRPVAGAREAVALVRERGVRVGVVTNQSGVARGLLTEADVRRVDARVDELIGPFDVWEICPHGPDDGCPCRKPRPGMVRRAAERLCADPADCVVIGDIAADVEAAARAGAHGILVPNPQTRPEETAAAPQVAPDLLTAVRAALAGPPRWRAPADERPSRPAYATPPDTTGRPR
ncbi:D-glycero-alpha-D-manno-heptose-1,7-bisphosphate 7-phosphatase [Streptomyces sp. NPDC048182]|uniref:D-glycero-alpha-D-manno-heptose-1,7-bisphosphate 7-phosphatase n=1 Tax=Streptomyces sp. NPDC048182 TaxID=3365507 RepID=UPI003722A1C5